MKKFILSLFLLFPLSLKADTQAFGGNFGGLNNGDSSIMIGDNEAQDLLNVDITDNGYGIRKRDGYAQFKTIGVSTWGVRGGYYFTDVSGNNNLIFANSKSIFKSVNSSAFTAFVTTDTEGSYYDFTDSQGYLWRANSNRDRILRYDGTTVTYFPSAPLGNQVEAMPDRLVISGVSSTPNRVYFSQAADFTNFTTGINEADPFTEDFGLPGQSITAIKYALGRLLVWTKTTLSFWVGSNQFDGQIQDVSTTVGTTQPNSIIYDNSVVYWQGQDGHFYSFDGNSIEKISKKINGSVLEFVNGSINNFIITNRADFESGTISNTLTSSVSPGDISLTTGTLIDSFDDGNLTSNPSWTTTSPTFSVGVANDGSSNVMESSMTHSLGSASVSWQASVQNTNQNFGGFRASAKASVTSGLPSFTIYICTTVPTASNHSGCYGAQFINSLARITKNNTILLSASAPNFNSVYKNFQIDISSFGAISTFVDSVFYSSTTDTTYSTFSYIVLSGDLTYSSSSGTERWDIDNVYMIPSTGTYISNPISLGSSITGFSEFIANKTYSGNGSLAYSIYTDTDSLINTGSSSSFISSQTISSGDIPTISTNSYLTIKADFTRRFSTETMALNDLNIYWFEGSPIRTFSGIDKNQRLYWSVGENSSSSTNATYIYDRRFDSWLKHSTPMSAPIGFFNSLYFGSPTSGTVYSYPSGNSDAGSSITAYWKSKDFIGGDPFIEKGYNAFSSVFKTQTGSSVSIDAFVNGSGTSSKTYSLSLTNSSGLPFVRFNDRLPNGLFGSFINFKIGNTAADSPFEFYSAKYDYTPKAWRVLP